MSRARGVVNGLMKVPRALGAALGWLWGQMVAASRNFWSLLNYLTLDRILPPWIADTIQFYIEAVPAALGLRGTSRERMVSAIVTLAIIAVFSTILTVGLTFGVLVLLVFLLFLGLMRLFPVVNSAWNRNTGDLVKEDYDIPGWERD